MNILSGKLKLFSPSHGYGFIESPTGGKDIFFYRSAIQVRKRKNFTDKEELEFELDPNPPPEGPAAVKVWRVGDREASMA